MSSEINILKAIQKHAGKSPIKKVAQEAGFGIDYTRYILNGLVKNKLAASSRSGRDWFELTAKGRKQLLPGGRTELKHLGGKRKIAKITKIQNTKLAATRNETIEELAPAIPTNESKVILVHNLNSGEGEDFEALNIGKAIEKAAKTLKGFGSLFTSFKDKGDSDH